MRSNIIHGEMGLSLLPGLRSVKQTLRLDARLANISRTDSAHCFNLDREVLEGSSTVYSAKHPRISAPSLLDVSAGSLAIGVTLSQVLEMVVNIIYLMAGLPGWNVSRASGGRGESSMGAR